MDWAQWYKHYEMTPSLQARLVIVRRQIVAALDECPPGPIRVVSVCAGDGRDVVGALHGHPRRNDVSAALLDSHAESLDRGRSAAMAAGLDRPLRFVLADATLARNYVGLVPADLVIISGVLGHLRPAGVTSLLGSLPMLCKPGGCAILNRHWVLNSGREQVPALRDLLRRTGFDELDYQVTAPHGFACLRVRFGGPALPLDLGRVLFEFVGLDRLSAESP